FLSSELHLVSRPLLAVSGWWLECAPRSGRADVLLFGSQMLAQEPSERPSLLIWCVAGVQTGQGGTDGGGTPQCLSPVSALRASMGRRSGLISLRARRRWASAWAAWPSRR